MPVTYRPCSSKSGLRVILNNMLKSEKLNLTKCIGGSGPGSVKITLTWVGDKISHQLNKKYLSRDYPTDVLSFNLDQPVGDGTYLLGEIVVNLDQAKRQAGQYNHDWRHEVAELVEHGILHLLGVHHEGDGG